MSKEAAKFFADDWNGHGNEKSDTQKFWLTFLRDVFAVDKPEKIIDFEISVPGGFIDACIAKTKVLIEQKSFGVDLTKKILQSDGEFLSPLEQAERYAKSLDEPLRWIVTCNFSEFRIYKCGREEPTVIKLRDLRYQFRRLKFLIDPTADDTPPEEKISAEAANIIENICLAFDKNYRKREPTFRDALSKFCMRLVFCFYADDAGIFTKKKFGDYLKKFPPEKIRDALQKFFDTLNTPEKNRPEDLDEDLKNFPYVDGGLFDEKISIPPIDKNLKLTIERAHILKVGFTENVKFSWREIDPPIFGAMFESLFNPEIQHKGGVYYTGVENIHKVIDPLFLDDLQDEFNSIRRKHKDKARLLKNFHDKISSLNFLDPACGSGNFLTETYLCLRRLENEVLEDLRALYENLPDDPVKVSIRQFYGIEIDPFAVAVAQTALWIAENQMIHETEGVLGKDLKDLPLTKYVTIQKANALRVDWKSFAPNVDYVIGNPPYIGARKKSVEQKKDIENIFGDEKNSGNLDYVCCWFKKAVDFIQGSKIRCAFLATNSVCQGESVGNLWKNLFAQKIHIDFAHRTFKWTSDSENLAHVHCVVVGFSCAENLKPKKIFDGKKIFIAQNINAYLVDGEDIFVESRNCPLQDGVPKIGIGNKPIDDGNYLFTPEEMNDFLRREPAAKKFFRPWFGAEEFIKGKKRYCLLLKDLSPEEIKNFPLIAERVEAVKKFRLASKSAGTRKIADKPTRFHVENFPRGNFLAIPEVSGENRKYIPIGFLNDSVVCSNKIKIVPDAEIFHFGILTSSIHMAWMRMTNCPLGTSYSYSIGIVYNNFPWPAVDAEEKELIAESAQKILSVREKFSAWTLAKLYNAETMPQALRSAHKWNDYNVALAYGFENFLDDETKVVAELMKLYERLTKD